MLLYVCVRVAPATCCPCQSCSSGKGLFLCYCKSAAYAALAKLAVNIRKRCFQGFRLLLQFLLLGFDCLQFLNSVLDLSFCHGFVLLSWFCLEAQHREALRRIAAVRLCGFLCILSGFTDALRYPSGCSSLTVFIIVHVHIYFNWHIQQTCTYIFVYFMYVHILKAML